MIAHDPRPKLQALEAIFARAAAERVFPGGVVFLARDNEILAHEAFGTTAYDDSISRAVTCDTLYDIASLTKLFTATAILIAARGANIALEAPLARFFDEFAAPPLSEITLRHLLNHSSGLKTPVQSLVEFPVETWVARIACGGLDFSPGARVSYTCTAYFLLGRWIELVAARPLEAWIEEKIVIPLELRRTLFQPLRRFSAGEIAPTERLENGVLHGVVHDEAARAVEESGSVSDICASGNAGVFSSAADLHRFAQMWLDGGAWQSQQILDERDATRALTDAVPAENYRQALGWHLDVSSWMSLRAPRGSAGHAGFTGPTMFISPATRHVCIVLNNRVYPTRAGAARFNFHRHIAEWMFAQTSLKEPR